ncbi:glutathione S-transferase theta-1-like [Gracilinanus agilis]|uniref:glutathione S-transferase theta-1-like n=1 Tax=Gracilinanus agilis TaxID=191870 RepID=UPI001CFE8087|nr:glutathione S-transferase theta-1-like [Gracilinanus agilis]
MVLNLYLDLLNPSCRSVYIFARRNQITFEMIPVDLMKAQHRSEDFVKINPFMKVPVLTDESFILRESIAILIYLCRRYRAPDYWYPADARRCARVDEFLAWGELNLKRQCNKFLWMKLLIPHFFKCDVPESKVEEATVELTRTLGVLVKKFLQNKAFLVGERLTLADLVALEDVVQALSSGYNIIENRPLIQRWRGRVESTLGQMLCDEVHEHIMTLKNAPPLTSDMVRTFDTKRDMLL